MGLARGSFFVSSVPVYDKLAVLSFYFRKGEEALSELPCDRNGSAAELSWFHEALLFISMTFISVGVPLTKGPHEY